MSQRVSYDVITVGGGLGGATLARTMAERGARVLVLEREKQFKDRVRGEAVWPWGVAEMRRLGIESTLTNTFAQEMPLLDLYLDGVRVDRRDVAATSSQRLPLLNWVHHEMEEALLNAAQKAGAEIHRGANVRDVKPGAVPSVTVDRDGRSEEQSARLVVCADGRGSVARKWAGFESRRDPYGTLFAGVLFDAMPSAPPEINAVNNWFMAPHLGQFAFLTPQSRRRVRAYAWYPGNRNYRLQGTADLPRFVEESAKAGIPAEWYAGARAVGPLATFDGTDTWVDHPYRDGVVLVGDAAATSDPSYGQGQSLTVRDVRVLTDLLLDTEDWNEAGHAYAGEHDRYYAIIHQFLGWFWKIFYESGTEADARRARALPLLGQDMSRMPNVLASGPEIPMNEAARQRFFGED